MSSEDHKIPRHRFDEPDWLSGDLGEYKSETKIKLYSTNVAERTDDSEVPIVQQSDYLKPFLLDIAYDGLESAYNRWGNHPPGPGLPQFGVLAAIVRPEFDADVIIVGAGMAGLVAAFELIRAGVKVKILEQTGRVGGRVHTYSSENCNLAPGLFGEAGAMRIPCANEPDVDDEDRYKDSTHYLTDFYITKFRLPTQPFLNSSPNTITNIYSLKDKTEVWERKHFANVWPKWNVNIRKKFKETIETIDDYYNATTGVVTDQLRTWLSRVKTIKDETLTWNRWINIWSQFTLESFLESNWDGIVARIPDKESRKLLKDLKCLLPWPQDAVRGYSVLSYTEQLDQSLVQYLRDQLGQWWSDNMHRIEGGMDRLPKAFAKSISGEDMPEAVEKALRDSIMLNHTVGEVSYVYSNENPTFDYVEISSYCTKSKEAFSPLIAKAVIITTPVNILRQITFTSITKTDENDGTTSPVVNEDMPKEFYQAIEDIFTAASTKIFIQTKTRFWESEHIKGGFSKTNLPIGQMHYVVPESETETEKGLLLIYTWKTEALLFGAMDKDVALTQAVQEISTIHREIKEQYDKFGIVHAWHNQPSAQGAYGLLKPRQFNNIRYLWYPVNNVFIAGETFSFAAGWIQGALESGMKSAYQFYARYHNVLENTH